MNTVKIELNLMDMEAVTGGHKNPTPSRMDAGIDGILNGKTYDRIAQWIADWLNGDNVRTRKVDHNQNIYDTEI